MLLALATGCSTFNREWRQAEKNGPPADDMAGRWEGTWLSHQSGHTDRLRCLMTKEEGGAYTAFFHAKYRRILSFSYKVRLAVTSTNGVKQFKGEANLGRLAGGNYAYQGTVQANRFSSAYTAKYDHGVFEMTRPEPKP